MWIPQHVGSAEISSTYVVELSNSHQIRSAVHTSFRARVADTESQYFIPRSFWSFRQGERERKKANWMEITLKGLARLGSVCVMLFASR